MKTKVLITGATGHLGQTLTKMLISRGYDVVAGVRRKDGDPRVKALKRSGAKIAEVDVLRPDSIKKCLEGVSGIFHLAAIYSFTSADNGQAMAATAVKGSLNVLRAAEESKVNTVIMTSSTMAVGSDSKNDMLLDEKCWNHHTSEPYAKAKTEAEWQAYEFIKDKNIRLVTILPAAILGPGFYAHTPSTMPLELAMRGDLKVIPPFEFSFVDVRDVAEAHIKAFEKNDVRGRFIVASKYCSMRELFATIKLSHPGAHVPTLYLPKFFLPILPFLDYVSHIFLKTPRFATKEFVEEFGKREPRFSSKRSEDELGWKPRPFSDSVNDTLSWIKTEFLREPT